MSDNLDMVLVFLFFFIDIKKEYPGWMTDSFLDKLKHSVENHDCMVGDEVDKEKEVKNVMAILEKREENKDELVDLTD